MMIPQPHPPNPNPPVWRSVLLVDDSKAQRRTLAVQLMRAGYEVIEAANAEEAMQICLQARPDIVISDWMMTGRTGLDFCRRFREMQTDRYGYFILLTSRDDKRTWPRACGPAPTNS